jgi:Sec-independent protein translocase protein TatA
MALYPFRIIRYAVILVALIVMFIFRKKLIKIVTNLFAGFKEKKEAAKEPAKEQAEQEA